jgi:hypothetical protein
LSFFSLFFSADYAIRREMLLTRARATHHCFALALETEGRGRAHTKKRARDTGADRDGCAAVVTDVLAHLQRLQVFFLKKESLNRALREP